MSSVGEDERIGGVGEDECRKVVILVSRLLAT